MECGGTPIEKMLLMLNDKIDRMHDRVDELYAHVNSARHTIPWAQTTERSVYQLLVGDVFERPEAISEWRRRGWDVWKVTVEGNSPTYDITRRLDSSMNGSYFQCELLTA